MTIHFICRGNAYRSIMAEAYLNSKQLPGVKVLSSGTSADKCRAINGPNFHHTLHLLKTHGIADFAKDHYGDQLTASRLKGNDVVIFMNQIVRDEYSRPTDILPAKTFTWDITDFGEADVPKTKADMNSYSEQLFAEIIRKVDELIYDLPTIGNA